MYEITVTGSQNFMGLEIPVVLGGFGADKKCISDKTIAEIHSQPEREIRRRIIDNIVRFREDIDVIDLKKRVGESHTLELILSLGYAKQSITQAKHIYLLSERGYAKLIKIMDTDLAWEVHDKLIDEYFELREEKQQLINEQANGGEYSFLQKHELMLKQMHTLELAVNGNNILSEALGKMAEAITSQQRLFEMKYTNQTVGISSTSSQQCDYEGADEEMVSWKKEVNSLMDIIIENNPGMFRNGKRSGVYAKVYNAMRIEDGVNWKKLAGDFKEKNHLLYVPSTITVCYCDENLRKNFMNRLRKMTEEKLGDVPNKPAKPPQIEKNTSSPVIYTQEQLDEIIQPLVDSLDGEVNRGAIKRRVYGQMERAYNVSWRSRETRFTNLNGFPPKSRGQMIQSNKSLMRKYKKAVRDLLSENEKEE